MNQAWQPLQNHPSGHLGRWVTLWLAEEMLDVQHWKMDIPVQVRIAHKGFLQTRLEEDLCWIAPYVPLPPPPTTQSVKGLNWLTGWKIKWKWSEKRGGLSLIIRVAPLLSGWALSHQGGPSLIRGGGHSLIRVDPLSSGWPLSHQGGPSLIRGASLIRGGRSLIRGASLSSGWTVMRVPTFLATQTPNKPPRSPKHAGPAVYM